MLENTEPSLSTPLPIIVFLRGLCTYCDNQLHIGPIRFGTMDFHLRQEFERRHFPFVSIDNMECGSIADMGQRALDTLNTFPPHILNPGVILVGHSMGGLVARWVAHNWSYNKVRAIITIATPHRGSQIAEQLANISTQNPRLYKLSERAGYNVDKKQRLFRHLYRKAINEFNQSHPTPHDVPCYSVISSLPPQQMSWPLRLLQRAYPINEANDGMLEVSSQRWGTELGSFALDHFAQLGYSLRLAPQNHRRVRREFLRMVETLANHMTQTP